MDINPPYTFLLGRHWIHLVGAVPFTLHQKVKFRVERTIITMRGEEDIMVAQTSSSSYVEAVEEALECSFRSFEIAEVMTKRSAHQESNGSVLQKKQLQEKGWSIGIGLGKDLHMNCKLVKLPTQDNTFGLGFKPTRNDKQQMMEKRKSRRLARRGGRNVEWGKMEFIHISQSFVFAGWVNMR